VPGVHECRRSSIERHLQSAPPVQLGYRGGRYPHRYQNKEQLFPPGSFYEYPSKAYPYEHQNAKGIVKPEFPDRAANYKDKGYTRTVTDRNKNVQGVIYHTLGAPDPVTNQRSHYGGFARAEELHSKGKNKKRK
jgi:hypothetical protein